MDTQEELIPARSSQMMSPRDTLLLVIDVQEKLWPHINEHDRILPRLRLLLKSANLLNVPILATEQYPKGLGATLPELLGDVEKIIEKMTFSAGIEPEVMAVLDQPAFRKILLVGIETHVCVQQTALDLLASGFRVYVATDAVGSRRSQDREVALARMSQAGVVLTTSEAAVFEWMVKARTPAFKQVSQLVREVPVDEPNNRTR